MPHIDRSLRRENNGRYRSSELPLRRWDYRRARALFVVLLAALPVSSLVADEPLRTFDGKHDISRIRVTVVYFVPRDRIPLPDWDERVAYFCRRIERFHRRELRGQSKLATSIHPRPFMSAKDSAALRAGDRDFIFFQTLREVESALPGSVNTDGAYPILLVLSDINWRELEDFYRMRIVDGQPQHEGQIIGNRHFPGAASGVQQEVRGAH